MFFVSTDIKEVVKILLMKSSGNYITEDDVRKIVYKAIFIINKANDYLEEAYEAGMLLHIPGIDDEKRKLFFHDGTCVRSDGSKCRVASPEIKLESDNVRDIELEVSDDTFSIVSALLQNSKE